MKTTRLIQTLALLCALNGHVNARPGEERPHEGESPRENRRGPERNSGRDTKRDMKGKREGTPPPVDRYLQHLKEKNPREFERLQSLRSDDPETFRRELRDKVMRHRGHNASEDRKHPLKEDVEAVRNAQTEASREAAVQNLREKISAMVDRHLERREQRIRKVREELNELEERHEQEQTRREEIIDFHLKRMLEE